MKNNGNEKKKSKAPIIVAAVVGLGIIGSAGNSDNDTDNTNRREPKETTSITTTITEETEWNIWEDEETSVALDFTENSNVITLIAGEQGEYGKLITMNKDTEFEESFYAYYVPYGTYKVTNIDEYQTQIGVYTDETIINENGWEEIANALHADVVKPNESITITVPQNYHVDIPEPSKIVLELIEEDEKSTTETQITTEVLVETTTPEITTTPKTKKATEATTTTADTSPTVYITPTGKKYHYDNTCNGGTYKESTLNQAERLHLEPCNKCVLG